MFRPFWSMLALALAISAVAQNPDVPEPGSVDAIAAATTDPHFVSPLVSYVPQSASVPSPEKYFGRIMGAPGELAGTEKAYSYARALAAASPRVRVFTIGKSEEGRDIILLAVSDEAGIRDLDRLKAATAALADPRRTNEPAAGKLIASSRPIYYFNAALHSDETGSTEAMLELAYRLAVSEQPMIRKIREQLGRTLGPGGFDPARDIAAITVNRWPHGYAYEYNSLWDKFWLEGGDLPCELARKPHGRIAIANADAGAYAYVDGAIDQAWRAVGEILKA